MVSNRIKKFAEIAVHALSINGYPKIAENLNVSLSNSNDQDILDSIQRLIQLPNKRIVRSKLAAKENEKIDDVAVNELLGGMPLDDSGWKPPVDDATTPTMEKDFPKEVYASIDIHPSDIDNIVVVHSHTDRIGQLREVHGRESLVSWNDGGNSVELTNDVRWKTADYSSTPLSSDVESNDNETKNETEENTTDYKTPKEPKVTENSKMSMYQELSDLFDYYVSKGLTKKAAQIDARLRLLEAGDQSADILPNKDDMPDVLTAPGALPIKEPVTEPMPVGQVDANSPMNQGQDLELQTEYADNTEDYDIGKDSRRSMVCGQNIVLDWPGTDHHGKTGSFQGWDKNYAVVMLDGDSSLKCVEANYVKISGAPDKLHGVHDAVMRQTGMDYYENDPHARSLPSSHDHVAADLHWPDPGATSTPPKQGSAGAWDMLESIKHAGTGQVVHADRSSDATAGMHKYEHESWDSIVSEARARGLDISTMALQNPLSQHDTDLALGVLGL